jgi:ribosome-associated toxin RatA of RatAB toxin-antitoxin module
MIYLTRSKNGVIMPKVDRSALVPHSAEQMYELVNDVLSYPEFLPGCAGSRVISRDDTHQKASIDVAKMGIRKTFSTSNTMVPGRQINIELLDGPFKSLRGRWDFIPLADDASKVIFHLEFEFNNPLIDFAFGKIFNELMASQVQAFIRRAKEVYRD